MVSMLERAAHLQLQRDQLKELRRLNGKRGKKELKALAEAWDEGYRRADNGGDADENPYR